jgi:hypothetical protein
LKVALKGGTKVVWMSRGRGMEAAGFLEPFVYLGVFLLLYCMVLVSGTARGWDYVIGTVG